MFVCTEVDGSFRTECKFKIKFSNFIVNNPVLTMIRNVCDSHFPTKFSFLPEEVPFVYVGVGRDV